jgi:hypothetical protein
VGRPRRRPIKNPRRYEVVVWDDPPAPYAIASFTDIEEHEAGDTIQVGERFWRVEERLNMFGGLVVLKCVEVEPTAEIHGRPIKEFFDKRPFPSGLEPPLRGWTPPRQDDRG